MRGIAATEPMHHLRQLSHPLMITLHDKQTGSLLGQISEEDLQLLMDMMEEESTTDTDYYISSETIDMLADDGASPTLLSLLRTALGERTGMDIAWTRG